MKDMDDLLSDSGVYNDQWSHKITSYHDTKCEGVSIRTDLLDLTKDLSVMEAYLEGLGVSCQVTAITGLICDLAPFTLKIDTAGGEPYFLLVKDNGDSYTYTLMTLDEYRASYQRVEGKLVVNGVEIDASPAPYIYGDTGHLPVLAIMKALGATVEGDATDIATVTLDGVTFEIVRFDLAIWWGDKSFPGGVSEICLYFTDGDMMLHQTEFQHFLDEAFPSIRIRIDGETDTVYVTK